MTTIETHAPGTASAGATVVAGDLAGVAGWLTTTDHKRIGRMFVGGSLVGLAGITVLGVLLGIDRTSSSGNVIAHNAVSQVFAAYRVGMVYAVLVPLMLGLAIAIVPLQVGARAIAFPRLAAFGFWTWLIGAAFVVGTIAANGGPDGGDRRMVAGFMLAHVILLLGLTAAAIAVATTIFTTRAPGMNMRRIPPFAFSALVGSIGLLICLPVLLGTLVVTYVDYRYGGSAFGFSKDLDSWIGFGFTGPQIFVYAIPAFGVALEAITLATRSRLRMRGIAFTGLGLIGLSALGGIVAQSTDVRANVRNVSAATAASDIVPYVLFNLIPVLGALVVLGAGGLALKARPRIVSPLLFGLLGAGMVLTGMLGNALYLIGDARLTGTVFIEGVRVYVVYGAVLAALGGLAYWAPKLWGTVLPDKQVLPLAALGFIATVLAALPYYIAGFAKQPADGVGFDYGGPKALWNLASTAGHALMLLTVLAFVGLLTRAVRSDGPQAVDDPWDAQTLEWATTSPAPYDNFAEVHTVASAEPLLDLKLAARGTD